MSDCSIKLEHGKTYVSRDGRIFGPLVDSNDGSEYPFELTKGSRCWTANGFYYQTPGSDLDLVRESGVSADPVNNPAHYTSGAVECIDAIQASMSVEAFRGYCKGNAQKYTWRYEKKGGVEDLHKAIWYLTRLASTFDA